MLVALTVFTGCDAFRKLAGRPTSEDIREKRSQIAMLVEAEKHRADSLEAALAAVKAQEKAWRDLSEVPGSPEFVTLSSLGGLASKDMALDNHYYIIIGAFKEIANAGKMLKNVTDAGFSGTIINFSSGLNGVGACPSDNLDSILDGMEKLKKEPFYPAEAWILVNE